MHFKRSAEWFENRTTPKFYHQLRSIGYTLVKYSSTFTIQTRLDVITKPFICLPVKTVADVYAFAESMRDVIKEELWEELDPKPDFFLYNLDDIRPREENRYLPKHY